MPENIVHWVDLYQKIGGIDTRRVQALCELPQEQSGVGRTAILPVFAAVKEDLLLDFLKQNCILVWSQFNNLGKVMRDKRPRSKDHVVYLDLDSTEGGATKRFVHHEGVISPFQLTLREFLLIEVFNFLKGNEPILRGIEIPLTCWGSRFSDNTVPHVFFREGEPGRGIDSRLCIGYRPAVTLPKPPASLALCRAPHTPHRAKIGAVS